MASLEGLGSNASGVISLVSVRLRLDSSVLYWTHASTNIFILLVL